MPMFFLVVLVPVLGLLGLLLMLVGLLLMFGARPGEMSLVGLSLVVVSLCGALFGGGHSVFFLLKRCLWPRKEDSEDRHSPDDEIGSDSLSLV